MAGAARTSCLKKWWPSARSGLRPPPRRRCRRQFVSGHSWLTLVQKHTQLPQVMMTRCRFIESRSPARNAYTLIELLAGIFIVAMATAVYIAAVRAKHG